MPRRRPISEYVSDVERRSPKRLGVGPDSRGSSGGLSQGARNRSCDLADGALDIGGRFESPARRRGLCTIASRRALHEPPDRGFERRRPRVRAAVDVAHEVLDAPTSAQAV